MTTGQNATEPHKDGTVKAYEPPQIAFLGSLQTTLLAGSPGGNLEGSEICMTASTVDLDGCVTPPP
jgi:hypothetical protein